MPAQNSSSTGLWAKVGSPSYPYPPLRWLRVYAFDPQASANLDTATINNSLIALPWETPWERPLMPGPCGEYIEVIDHDPASGYFYEPVDLNDPVLLAQNGLPASEGRPQFHQQMVYAVAMKTIQAFERALGRVIFFAREIPSRLPDGTRNPRTTEMVQRLRIYPHALRDENAYYSPQKCAILFGYFQPDTGQASGDRWVFTALSQDIVAHETTHAILHGVHRRSIQPSNLDTLAFHEGFADIVALLQHFTMKDVLKQQIAHTHGDIRRKSLLNSLAGQFGQALGRKDGALRSALKLVELDAEIAAADSDAERQSLIRREWEGYGPPPGPDAVLDPEHWEALLRRIRLHDDVREAHSRGGYLVAAVFDAFATIYERRTADLMRLADASSQASASNLPPELVDRLATEASKAADHVLRMCVRALDYVPPVDMTFGEYLRAIITADHDLVPDDIHGYRIAVAQAFRRRGIVPDNSLSMAPDSLLWEAPDPAELPCDEPDSRHDRLFADLLPRLQYTLDYKRLAASDQVNFREWSADIIVENQRRIHGWLEKSSPADDVWAQLLGIEMLSSTDPRRKGGAVLRSIRWKAGKEENGAEIPVLQVYSARVARRAGPDGQELNQLVIQVVQKRRGYFDPDRQAEVDAQGCADEDKEEPDFWFRGGATLLVDLRDGGLRYAIRKRIGDKDRLAAQRDFERRRRFGPIGVAEDGQPSIYGTPDAAGSLEPFAMAHRGLS